MVSRPIKQLVSQAREQWPDQAKDIQKRREIEALRQSQQWVDETSKLVADLFGDELLPLLTFHGGIVKEAWAAIPRYKPRNYISLNLEGRNIHLRKQAEYWGWFDADLPIRSENIELFEISDSSDLTPDERRNALLVQLGKLLKL